MESVDITLLDPVTGTTFQFPVNPAEIEARGEAMLETVEITRLGEVDWFAGNKRTQLNWESFLPGHYDPQYCRYVNIPDPLDAREQLISWRITGTVLRLIITGTHKGVHQSVVNAPVLIAEFSPKLKGGEPDDVYYTITMRQYVSVQIRTAAEAGANAAPAPARLDLMPVPGRYTVQAGDTLYLIAKQQLESGERWSDIYDLNKDAIGPDPNTLEVGMSLAMPGAGAPPQTVPPATPTTEEPRWTKDMLIAALHDPDK